MTAVLFVRHAQPDERWADDRTRPLTAQGLADREQVTALLTRFSIGAFYSSPYKRSVDTIAGAARLLGREISLDERLRERRRGENAGNYREIRWADLDFHEPGGESIRSTQARNLAALGEILLRHRDETVVIGSHGAALSSILHHYDPSFGWKGFERIWHWMPYVIRLEFAGEELVGQEELLHIDRGY